MNNRIKRAAAATALGVALVAAPAVGATNVAMAQGTPVQEQQRDDDGGGESYWGLLGLLGLLGLTGLGGRRRGTVDHHGGAATR
jgi:MYXO-CTERM domain-containing protein